MLNNKSNYSNLKARCFSVCFSSSALNNIVVLDLGAASVCSLQASLIAFHLPPDATVALKAEKSSRGGGAAKWGYHLGQGGLGEGAPGAGCARICRLLPG